MLRSPANRFEVVHIHDLRSVVESESFQRSGRVPGRDSLKEGWYLVIRPALRGRRGESPTEYLGPFESGSDAGAAIAAIDAQFACHA